MKQIDIPTVNSILKKQYNKHRAPVIELIKARTDDPFKILVSTILSARTKDETTSAVSKRLYAVVKKPSDLRSIPLRRLQKLIHPIGFFRTKAKHLRQLPEVLETRFGGRIPQTIDELCELPGVGRKTANLVMTAAFDEPAICVDVHVHRICNRLGFLRAKTPFDTEMALRRRLPKRYWKTWNRYLVSYGQTVCTPRNPKCNSCPISRYCRKIGVRVPPAG